MDIKRNVISRILTIAVLTITISTTMFPVSASAKMFSLNILKPSGIVLATSSNLHPMGSFDEINSDEKDDVLASASSTLEEIKKTEKKNKTYRVQASAYSSTVDQCDSTPFITAMGTRVRDGIIATNFLPFGTKIKIPDIYGDKIFVVEDRMNKRYWMNLDIWFAERSDAVKFGRKMVTIEIVSLPELAVK